MKTMDKILGMLWLAISSYCGTLLFIGTCRIIASANYRFDNLSVLVFFVLLYLAGAIASFYMVRGSKSGRIIVGVVAFLTAVASVIGFFAFFSMSPHSLVSVMFDLFALVSAIVLFASRRRIPA